MTIRRMMTGHSCTLLLIILTSSNTDSKNVVFLPFFVTSHVRLYDFVADELSNMGHNVWMGLPSDVRNVIESSEKVQKFWYDQFWESSVNQFILELETTFKKGVDVGTDPDWTWLFKYEDVISQTYFKGLQNGTFVEFISSLKPDLIVLDWYPSVNEHVAIPYKLKVPFAILSALHFQVTAKMPYDPVAETFNSPYMINQASLFEKVWAVTQNMVPLFQHIFNDRGYTKQFFPNEPDVPPANELMSQAEVYIVESDPIFDYPRPALPNWRLIGGLSAGPAKELKEPFKSFIERSRNGEVGVAVLSFGTLFMNLPKKLELKLVSVLKRIKLNTIWRSNITSPDPDKILTSTWLPQNDLLGNKNVKVYMTHSGLHSIYEGIYHGVPTVCLPLFYDQHANAERAEEKGFCLNIDVLKATEDQLVNAIEEVASSQKIRSSIGKASEIYRELYKDPKKEAAFWLDHVMRYGGFYMRYSGQKIPIYMVVMDYLIAFVSGAVFVVGVFIIYCVVKRVHSFYFKPKRHVKKG